MASNAGFRLSAGDRNDWLKPLLVCAVFGLPIMVLVFLLAREQNKTIDFAAKELDGARYLRSAAKLGNALAQHQLALDRKRAGEASDVAAAASAANAALQELEAADKLLGEALSQTGRRTSDQVGALRTHWAAASGGDRTPASRTLLWGSLRDLERLVGDTSNLILDPDLDTYYLMDAALVKLPDLQAYLGRATGLAVDVAAGADAERGSATALVSQFQSVADDAAGNYTGMKVAFKNDSSPDQRLKPALESGLDQVSAAAGEFAKRMAEDVLKLEGQDKPDAKATVEAAASVAAAVASLWDKTTDNLEFLLKQRIAGATRAKWTSFGMAGVAVAAAAALVFWIILGFSSQIRAASRAIAAVIGRLGSTSRELVDATAAQTSGADEQGAAVAQALQSATQTQATAEQAAERAKAMGEGARAAAKIAADGRAAALEAVAAMTKVKSQVESTAHTILALAEQAQAVGEIVAKVNEIAEKTNMLALNAAIEASRAGEYGRGFAVVAKEVKALADQSKQSTEQIREILGEIQKATNSAVLSTEQSTRDAGEAAAVVARAGDTIDELNKTVARSAQGNAQVVAASVQQLQGMQRISETMKGIDQIARAQRLAVQNVDNAARTIDAVAAELVGFSGRRDDAERRPAPDAAPAWPQPAYAPSAPRPQVAAERPELAEVH